MTLRNRIWGGSLFISSSIFSALLMPSECYIVCDIMSRKTSRGSKLQPTGSATPPLTHHTFGLAEFRVLVRNSIPYVFCVGPTLSQVGISCFLRATSSGSTERCVAINDQAHQ
jgi:hypothetical protein